MHAVSVHSSHDYLHHYCYFLCIAETILVLPLNRIHHRSDLSFDFDPFIFLAIFNVIFLSDYVFLFFAFYLSFVFVLITFSLIVILILFLIFVDFFFLIFILISIRYFFTPNQFLLIIVKFDLYALNTDSIYLYLVARVGHCNVDARHSADISQDVHKHIV